ncbi:olefin beta-lactone synthetase [Shewanella intestini]|uniref:AMP-binding protein n=1 Tax=Shewanella intestini TaxID=2017544 RepID=A0ABS5HYP8_9GAMM|nr:MULTISPECIES: fatty acid CoA ligase family protein [Shewanella]MBR9726894.1 AMP-binding protein [Shewanella intestini]MRG34540.1 AMP-binding protein [Shewanella sp. XMDDZSB0408]
MTLTNNPTQAVLDANICRHLTHAAIHHPHELAVAVQQATTQGDYQYHELDFAQLEHQSNVIAHGLNQFGIHKGMKAVLMVTPSIAFFSLTFALFKAGIVPILVDPGMGIKNLKQCFAESEPDAFIGIPKAHIARRILGWGKGSVTKVINVGGGAVQRWLSGAISLESIVALGEAVLAQVEIDANEPSYPMTYLAAQQMAAILFTSGSTGTPKGVVYSHSMFEGQINALREDYAIKPGERDLATFPLFSLFGPALGMASIVPDMDASKPITAKPEHLFAAIEKYQCSNMFVNPALLDRLGQAGVNGAQAGHKLTSIKRVISAGAPATIASIELFSQMLNQDVEVFNSYGATESLPISMIGSNALMDTVSLTDSGAGICVGQPIAGVKVDIIAIDDGQVNTWSKAKTLAQGEIGEIVVSSPMASQAYYQRPKATEMAKIADGDIMRHRMGDVGYIDDIGRLWMCGRKGHLVDGLVTTAQGGTQKQVSKRFFSIPCERIYNTHPQVKRSALVGVNVNGQTLPLVCIELTHPNSCRDAKSLYQQLIALGQAHDITTGIERFLIHPDFPVDVRHNAKIFREKLAVWAQKQWKEC